MNRQDRQFDIIVWGATGFTGRLVAEYLAGRDDNGLRWAMAGRNAGKLAALRDELGAAGVPLLTARIDDAGSLEALARDTRVMISTVGPYARFGTALLTACVEAGTDYCDLSAEIQWMRHMQDTLADRARETGARVINSCGYDSIPSDMGNWFLQREAQERFGRACERVTMLVKAAKGGASGGTAASIVNLVRETRQDPEARRYVAHPYSLNPVDRRSGPRVSDQTGAVFDASLGGWTAPFVMAISNTRVVRRSNALAGTVPVESFLYRETIPTGRGVGGWFRATLIAGGIRLLLLGAAFAPTRAFLTRFVLPKPGEGPDRQAREHGFFNHLFIGECDNGEQLRLRVTGDMDPGYGSTSKMLAESALALALDGLDTPGGFWTPSTGMGDALFRRLTENAGLCFTLPDQ